MWTPWSSGPIRVVCSGPQPLDPDSPKGRVHVQYAFDFETLASAARFDAMLDALLRWVGDV